MAPRLNYFDVNSKYYSPDYPTGITVPPQPPVMRTLRRRHRRRASLPLIQVTGPYCVTPNNDRLYFQDLNLNGFPIPPANTRSLREQALLPCPRFNDPTGERGGP